MVLWSARHEKKTTDHRKFVNASNFKRKHRKSRISWRIRHFDQDDIASLEHVIDLKRARHRLWDYVHTPGGRKIARLAGERTADIDQCTLLGREDDEPRKTLYREFFMLFLFNDDMALYSIKRSDVAVRRKPPEVFILMLIDCEPHLSDTELTKEETMSDDRLKSQCCSDLVSLFDEKIITPASGRG